MISPPHLEEAKNGASVLILGQSLSRDFKKPKKKTAPKNSQKYFIP